MEPAFKEGQVVVGVNTKKFEVGDYVFADHNDQEVLKFLRILEENRAYLSGNDRQHDIGWVDISEVSARIVWPRR